MYLDEIFPQDYAPPYKLAETKHGFPELVWKFWPSNSVNLHIIENFLSILKTTVGKRHPKNVKELESFVLEEFYLIPNLYAILQSDDQLVRNHLKKVPSNSFPVHESFSPKNEQKKGIFEPFCLISELRSGSTELLDSILDSNVGLHMLSELISAGDKFAKIWKVSVTKISAGLRK